MFAISHTSGPERFENLREVFLFPEGAPGAERSIEIETVWEHRGGLVFKFRGVDSIDDAERLRGAEVRAPAASRRALPEGEFYQADLIGCEVVDRAAGERLGVVTGWKEFGGPPLLEVEGPDATFLLPFARAICVDIDVAARRIVVDMPEGLKELGEKK